MLTKFSPSFLNNLKQSRPARYAAWWLTGVRLPILFIAIYGLAFLLPFPLLVWYSFPKSSFGSIAQYSLLAALGLALAGLGLVVLYRQMWITAREQPSRAVAIMILAGWLGASAVLLFTYPGQSSDLGDYIFRAHMLVHLDRNPLTTTPAEVVAKDDYPYIGWYREVDPYGPVWHGLAAMAHLLAGESFLANVLAFKILAIVMIGISGGCIYAILRRIAPHYALAGLALWWWNPLVLNEGALHGHNDLVVAAVILLGLWLILRKNWTAGMIVLMTAGLVKANAWIVLPVAGLWIVRQGGWLKGLKAILPALVTGGILIVLAYAPLGGLDRLPEMARERGWWPTGTWTAAIFFFLRDTRHWPHATVVQWIIGGASLLCAVIAGIALIRIRDLRAGVWAVVLIYLLVGTHWFQPWYATWLMAITAITVNRRLINYTIIFACFMLWHPIVVQFFAIQFEQLALQFFAARLELLPGGYDIIMAATALLVPQILALRLVVISRAGPPTVG